MEGEVRLPSAEQQVIAVKAWTAYIQPVVGFCIVFGISAAVAVFTHGFGLIGAVLALGHLVYRVIYLRTYKLYHDDAGVWVFAGVFPWEKGVRGVKWRDLDEAVYYQGFWSWLLKSYTINLGHRFTKSAEIRLDHMKAGDLVAREINGRHQRLVAANALG